METEKREIELVEFSTLDELMAVFGPYDANVSLIERALDVSINARDKQVEVRGEAEARRAAAKTLKTLQRMVAEGETVNDWAVSQAIEMTASGQTEEVMAATRDAVAVTYRGKPVKCKTHRPESTISRPSATIPSPSASARPAPARRTSPSPWRYTALKAQGDLPHHPDPPGGGGRRKAWLSARRPSAARWTPTCALYTTRCYDFLGQEQAQPLVWKPGVIEVAPIGLHARAARSTTRCLVILDEGQNATLETLKMVLTRFGEGAKVVVTGDVTQIDLGQERTQIWPAKVRRDC